MTFLTGLLVALATAAPSRPSPEDALRVLLASRSELNRTGVPSLAPDGAISITVRSNPANGPFGELRSTPMPVSCCNLYVHRLPHRGHTR